MSRPWVTALELAQLGLADWPSSEFRSRAKLVKLQIPSRIREGMHGGGGREYDSSALPLSIQRALLARQVAVRSLPAPRDEAAPARDEEPAPRDATPATQDEHAVAPRPERPPPTREESSCADARAVLVQRVRELGQVEGTTRAAHQLSELLASGQAAADLLQIAATANQRPREGERVHISPRTLFRWITAWREGGWPALLPAPVRARPLAASLDDELTEVLRRYSASSGAARNLTEVTQTVRRERIGSIAGWKKLYDRARRVLPKLDQVALIKARHTGAERAALLPYKRRLTRDLKPLDVCLVDGHTFKAKVRHPVHGQPFAPEVTVLIDAATRKICGWSVAYSENVIAVGDCIRHASTTHGVWAIYYTDRGPGEANKQFDCPTAGLFARLGATHELGRPAHPQGHGLIERSWRTHMIRCARQFGSYQGEDADAGRVRSLRLEIAREKTAVKRAAETGDVVRLTGKVPSWEQFLQAIEQEVERYNGEHRHRNLPKHESGPHEREHMTPSEAWAAWLEPADQQLLDGPTSRMLHMPATLATAVRGWVRLNNAHYSNHAALMQVDGQRVRVHFDIHDPRAVWVWTLDGQFVCEAGLEADAMGYFPKSVVQMAREKRADRRIRLREEQIELARAELAGLPPPAEPSRRAGMVPTAPAAEVLELVERLPEAAAAGQQRPEQQAADGRPVFDTPSDRYEWLMQHRAAWSPADSAWLAAYAASAEYEDLREYFSSRGLAWLDGDTSTFNSAG